MRREQEFYLQLVNPDHPVTMIPSKDMLIPAFSDFPDILLECYAAYALRALIDRLHAFDQIVPVSGFRSQKEQQNIWDASLKEHGESYTRKYVAIPGCSEHQTGLAIDLALKKDMIDFICPDFPDKGICGQFKKLAPEYGFILRYPKGKEDITHISWEPWHFRYVGTPYAAIITKRQLVLEEYLLNSEKHLTFLHTPNVDTMLEKLQNGEVR